jgi:hypothetical protein
MILDFLESSILSFMGRLPFLFWPFRLCVRSLYWVLKVALRNSLRPIERIALQGSFSAGTDLLAVH